MNRPESDIGETPSPGYALLSVYDKTGLVEFARVLADAGYRLVSTGGTFAELQAAGLEVRQVSQVTGSPEILDGRVKTLHPAIHGGLLARRSEDGHMEQIAEHRITPVDVVVNNLYPFTDTVSVNGATLDDALENIDIGGPAMTRAAAKNFPDVIVVVDPADYERIGGMIASGGVPHAERRRLAAKGVSARRPVRHRYLHVSAAGRPGRAGDAGRTDRRMVARGHSPLWREPAPGWRSVLTARRVRRGRQRRTAPRHRHVVPELLRRRQRLPDRKRIPTSCRGDRQARQPVRPGSARAAGRGVPAGVGGRPCVGVRRHRRIQLGCHDAYR